jgi:Dipeptidyl peptidase IV (DPP IV) N-terminal region
MKLKRILILAVILSTIFSTPTSHAQTQPKTGLTLEWIFSDEGRRVASVPSYVWLSDGKLMLYDGRLPAPQRAFEILDPGSGARRDALDMKAAIASLNALLPASSAQQVLAWPQSFDQAGRHGVYVLNGDLFVLDVAKASFSRLTKTSEEERSPEFSPDGNKLAFVRKNNLYASSLSNDVGFLETKSLKPEGDLLNPSAPAVQLRALLDNQRRGRDLSGDVRSATKHQLLTRENIALDCSVDFCDCHLDHCFRNFGSGADDERPVL